MADVARELDAPIEDDLRAAKRLIDMTFRESNIARAEPSFKRVQVTLFDPAEIPEFRSWRTDKFRQ